MISTQEEDSNNAKESKGTIVLSERLPNGVDLNENTGEITLKTEGKKVYLKAANGEEAADWARNIMNWLAANNA